jgi:hypothetical protein
MELGHPRYSLLLVSGLSAWISLLCSRSLDGMRNQGMKSYELGISNRDFMAVGLVRTATRIYGKLRKVSCATPQCPDLDSFPAIGSGDGTLRDAPTRISRLTGLYYELANSM